MKKSFLYVALFFITLSGQVQGEPESFDDSNDFLDLSLEDLLNIKVVTSSKYLEKSIDSPANIHVITAKQISDRGYKNIEDLLRNLPGVDLQEYSSMGNYNVVTMRGAKNNNKFIILKDGVRISPPAGEINAISENYPLYFAKRVEVLIGPASVTYGADAFAGVINIISFDANDKESDQISVSVGNDKYLNAYFQLNHLFKNGIYVNVGVQGHYSQELNFGEDYPELYDDPNKDYNFKNTDGFQFFADAKLNEKFTVGVHHSKITYSSDFTAKPFFSAFSGSLIEESLTSIYAKYEFKINDKTMSNTLFTYQLFTLGNASNFNNLFTGFNKQYKYGRTARYSLNQDFNYQLNPQHLLSAGFVYDYFDIIPRGPDLPSPYEVKKKPDKQNFFYPNTELPITFFQQRDENIGIYLQDNWQISDKWRQVTGLRYDHHTLYGNTFNPRLTTIFQADQYNIFKLIYAHSFLAPPPSLAFNSFGSFTGEQNSQNEWLSVPAAAFRVPNENLQPETLKSIELNYEHWFNQHSKIKFAPYYNRIDDVIGSLNDPVAQQAIPGASLIKTNSFKNIGKSTAYGIDISVNYAVEYENSNIEYWISTSYVDGELIEENIKSDLPMVSKYKVKAGLSYNYQTINKIKYLLSPIIRWRSATSRNYLDFGSNVRSEVAGNFIMDLHSEVTFSQKLALKLTITNLFDKKHYQGAFTFPFIVFDKAPQPRRLIYATLEYNF